MRALASAVLLSFLAAKAVQFDPAVANNPDLIEVIGPNSKGSAVLRAAVLLDRAHFSPGEIDGRFGRNMSKAAVAFQAAHRITPTGVIDTATWNILKADRSPALIPYTVTKQDVAGPFEKKIPRKMMEQARLPAMSYRSPLEELAERFHCSPSLLAALNPGKHFDKEGEQILVLNVGLPAPGKAKWVEVDGVNRSVKVYADAGRLLVFYPASVGSKHDPLPLGEWKVVDKQFNPVFHYNPKLFWDASGKDSKATIKPGPNNPVGLVWIGLSKEHYGIHGTPEPALISRTQSHGCIRLTNWDALQLAQMVDSGTPVIITDGAGAIPAQTTASISSR